jgi:hypothetical protein
MDWIRRFQFVQESPGVLRLLLVAADKPSPQQIATALRAVESRLDGAMSVQVEVVSEIPRTPTGKFYPYLSRERQEAWRSARIADRG